MTDCPPGLRGDLSKWLCEINSGVYIGQVSKRVREALWERICQNVKNGRATMVFSTSGEQKMAFRVHNSVWTPVDFDGIVLMKRPLPQAIGQKIPSFKPGFSKVAKQRMVEKRRGIAARKENYIVLDLETTGLQAATDEILEIGALEIRDGVIEKKFSRLVQCERQLPEKIVELTGITQAMMEGQGIPLEHALLELLEFIGSKTLLGYNIAFDMEFLRVACKKFHQKVPACRCIDLLKLSRRKVREVKNYKLDTLASHFLLPKRTVHRALEDCKLIQAIYQKLNESG